ncbi:MAG: MBL fold metallo-hydrolase [Bacteroides sp.]|nr:MBL fold metallo-hydrolase [Bacteroides sp.]
MRLIVLGSSSKGNGYLLDDGTECLMIECGVSFAEVKRALDFDISRIVGCVVSHEHGDHARHVARCLEARIPLYVSHGTANGLGLHRNGLVREMAELGNYAVGGFTVRPFATQHDAAEPFGFLIHHPACGTVLFATDTYYLQYTFSGLNNIMIECNYRRDILDGNVKAGYVPAALKFRTERSHMEYRTCVEALDANDLSAVNNIVLIHLSDANSDAAAFARGIREATGKTVHVAGRGLVIDNFDKSPF